MLKRIYASNYRCLVNFEINLDRLTLLMGPNGGGKSTLLDLLFGIRQLVVNNARVSEVFPSTGLTRWSGQTEQAFELDVQGKNGLFSYRLVNSYSPDLRKQKLKQERLTFDGKPLFSFDEGEVQLYHDDHVTGPSFSSDWSLSALANVVTGRPDNEQLTWFKNWLKNMFVLSLQPRAMPSETRAEMESLNRDGSNFSSWYRFLSQEYQDKTLQLTDRLRKIIPGFHAFKLEQAGTSRILKVGFVEDEATGSHVHRDAETGRYRYDFDPQVVREAKSTPVYFDFEEISDGQRVLLVLYSLLIGLQDLGHTVFLDEPENYLALPEIQPWLMELNDSCGEGFPQAVLISHHPELIDYLGPESGRWIARDALGPSRVKELPKQVEGELKLSELIARGWNE